MQGCAVALEVVEVVEVVEVRKPVEYPCTCRLPGCTAGVSKIHSPPLLGPYGSFSEHLNHLYHSSAHHITAQHTKKSPSHSTETQNQLVTSLHQIYPQREHRKRNLMEES